MAYYEDDESYCPYDEEELEDCPCGCGDCSTCSYDCGDNGIRCPSGPTDKCLGEIRKLTTILPLQMGRLFEPRN